MAIALVRSLCARQDLVSSGAFLLPSYSRFTENFSAAVAIHSRMYRVTMLL